jgi:dATP pyrophosphohydrolase
MADVSSRVIEVCIFRLARNEPRYLLVCRSANDPLYPGLWQIVTGMLEGNEHAVTAALREVHEETGLKPQRFWVVPFIDLFYSAPNNTVNLSPFFALQVNEADEPRLSAEHQAFEWLPYQQADSRLVWPGQKMGLKLLHEYVVGGLLGGKLAEVKDLTPFERNKT